MLTLKQLRDDKELAIKRLAKKGVDAAPVIEQENYEEAARISKIIALKRENDKM